MKVRQNLYIDHDIANALDILSGQRGVKKSRIVNDALRSSIEHHATEKANEPLTERLDHVVRDIGLARRDLSIVIESLALFIRYQLNVVAPLPRGDLEARRVGRHRFAEFVRLVGEQIKTGERSLGGAPRPEDLA